ncbi:hypothetical protein M0R45_034365 [Rubus argutus]|uniref:Uncharacterized protein n=1 Tax=Rubus argutus TaxID=59490 RepID=A0AAW1VRR0_RUBAR
MCLKTAQWTEGITPEASPESESDSAATAVGNLVNSLTTQRVYSEVTLALLVPPIRRRVGLHHQSLLPDPIDPRASKFSLLLFRNFLITEIASVFLR